MPSYVNHNYVQSKLAHIDEQISALRRHEFTMSLGGASGSESVKFQMKRQRLLRMIETLSDDDVQGLLNVLTPAAQLATDALKIKGDLIGVPEHAVHARAFWELVVCATTPPEVRP